MNWVDVKDLKPGIYWATYKFQMKAKPELVRLEDDGESLFVLPVAERGSEYGTNEYFDYYGPLEPPQRTTRAID